MMMYDSLLARSFSKHEQKKFGYVALLASFFIALSFCTVFKPYLLGPLTVLNLQLSMGATNNQKLKAVNDTGNSLHIPMVPELVMKSNLTVNVTSSSQQAVREIVAQKNETRHNTTLPQQSVRDDEITAKDTPDVNHTSSSYQQNSSGAPKAVLNETSIPQPAILNETSIPQPTIKVADFITKKKVEPICNLTGRSEFCEIKGDIRVDGNSATVYIVLSETDIFGAENTTWKIRPYARKGDIAAMSMVREWTVRLISDRGNVPQCNLHHNVPAVLFSSGGYSGNYFHSITDIVVPLYATARPFDGKVQLLITNKASWWIAKFETFLKALSSHEIVEIDRSKDIYCFPSIVVGFKGRSRKELSIDSSNSAHSMKDFRQFLRSSYSLKKEMAIKIKDGQKRRPRLLIISRKGSRTFTNVGEIAKMARTLGYKVLVAEADANVPRFAQLINSCDVVMGVHGAGLTNMVFLPENAILIQVVPKGAEWVSQTYFEEPAPNMNIRYLEYMIQLKESSLMQQYPADHVVLTNPSAIAKQGWLAFKAIYLDKQNVQLDLNRFRPTLLKALELLHQ